MFETVRPGRVPDGCGADQASHLNLSVFARGLLGRLCTRVYFEGDPALDADPVLALVPEDRRYTLIARRDSNEPMQWNFEIHLQGQEETVFFDI
jgi:protocatechuate 3,4-dioxygenase alpha subunit